MKGTASKNAVLVDSMRQKTPAERALKTERKGEALSAELGGIELAAVKREAESLAKDEQLMERVW